jgi:hypothetical protein
MVVDSLIRIFLAGACDICNLEAVMEDGNKHKRALPTTNKTQVRAVLKESTA